MKINEFLLKLVDDDCEVKNLAFKENKNEFINLISNFKSKLAIAVSSSFFNENISFFSNFENINNIESVISLPIYKEYSNLILMVLNHDNNSNEFLFIDTSDSLIHKSTDDDISDEVYHELIDYKQSDDSLYLNVSAVFKNNVIPQVEEDSFDEILDLYVDDDSKGLSNKAMSDVLQDNILDLNEEELLAFNRIEEVSNVEDDFLELIEEEKKPLKQRIIPNRIVDGILKLKEEKFNQQKEMNEMPIPLYDGLVEITSANVLKEMGYSKKRPNPENILKRNNIPLIDGKVQFKKLEKIADLQNIDEKNTNDSLLVTTCKLCESKLVQYNHDIEDFNGEMYVEITNFSDDVLEEYVYEYLNSDNGINEILYFSKGYNYIRAELIRSVKIPIPSIEVQKEIVKVSKDAREFFKTVDLLKKEFNSNILDYKHISQSINELKGNIEIDSQTSEVTEMSKSWRHAFQSLIWPLAISYLSATKGGFELVEKKDNYLKLFEFTTAFNAIILLSGLPDEVYLNNFDYIWTDNSLKQYKNMTFGTWFVLSKNLAKVYNDNNFTSKLDEEFFERITSNKLLDLLNKSKFYRNEEFHSAMANAYEAEKTIEILDNYLKDIFDVLDIYSNYKLIYTTGKLEYADQMFNHEVILLNGPCAQPIYDKIIFDLPLEAESLYLYNPKNNKKLLIKDNLMKFIAIDKNKKHWALYIYNGCDKHENNAFYKCFQSKEKNLKERISSLRQDILL